jgi:hypothetical protein
MILTYDDYASFLIDWCNANVAKFEYLYLLKGGWELWVQADYASFVLQRDTRYEILREVPIYTNEGQRVDLLFNNDSGVVTQKIAIEIKCQTFLTRDDFIAGVQRDALKLAQNNLKLQFRTCETGLMGIGFTQGAIDWMVQNGFFMAYRSATIGCGIRKLYP